ncbi:MAG TPA: aldo/keto reductase, partial [Prolixibacteraceae bacterium]|nr:aldo/keto reductase [Prolixibacteraceae bacterium]
ALVWLLKDPRVTSVLIGASSVKQLEDNVAALNNMEFTSTELEQIEVILSGEKFMPSSNPFIKFRSVKESGEYSSSRGDFIKNLAKRVASSNPGTGIV